ncbi:MAG: hypothetical protein U1E76_25450 [Planctomycetota bacterium]
MPNSQTAMRKRVNVSLPEDTLRLLDRAVKHSDRSRLIDAAVRFYIKSIGKAKLRAELKRGALANAERDQAIAAEWFPLEDEAWPNDDR